MTPGKRRDVRKGHTVTSMPDVIAEYFRAAAVDDTDAVVATFTHDATVVDDGHHHAGHSRIRAWRDQTSAQFSYTTTILDSAPNGAGHHVTTQVAGDFPGSPVRLGFRFTLAGERIAALAIAPDGSP